MTAAPVRAAEKLFLTFGPFKLSLRVSSLETFAKEGKIDRDLAFYLGRATPEQQALFRKALTEPIKASPVLLSRLFYSGIGEAILTRIGKGVTLEGGLNGKYGMRAAIVLAAFEPEGLTMLNFFKKFPTNIQFQGEHILAATEFAEKLVRATELLTVEMKQLSSREAASEPSTDFAKMPDLRQPGSFGVQPKQTWVLKDSSRDRQFYVDVYKPQSWRSGKTPVVVFSHGFSSRPEDFGDAAEHLASYGYVVVLPQHPGSDISRMKAFLQGFHRNTFDVNEFINRPKDISYTIDELERRNQSEFQGQLNLESVGVAGHSFGGSTAFAIAGAVIDFENLENECNRPFGGLNTSLLLQCRALELPRQIYDLRDRRVSAVFVVNPVNSSIFGRSGLSKIQIPLFIAGGNYDPATPFVLEQGRVFPWLKTSDKYLAMVEGQAHVDFSQLDAGIKYTIESFDKIALPSPDLIHNYRDSLAAAFFGTYLDKQEDYKPYLQSAYAAYLSQGQEFKLFLISAPSADKLGQTIDDFRRKYNFNS
ncbi:alpha/beta hydrolase [Pseudanabaena sp. PCC 6802]|uniref:alpha/beta hydrolase n=1 Tax=Pseudanabaena sp. PCC 6802 TaxID=118173 RepID=UPI001872CA41|nr:alpha/beta hydrolase [Pseudanabaena sp. PCC 6802]